MFPHTMVFDSSVSPSEVPLLIFRGVGLSPLVKSNYLKLLSKLFDNQEGNEPEPSQLSEWPIRAVGHAVSRSDFLTTTTNQDI